MQTEFEALRASQYRREAESLRNVLAIIRDGNLRSQLLSIARQYDASAAVIEQDLKLKGDVN